MKKIYIKINLARNVNLTACGVYVSTVDESADKISWSDKRSSLITAITALYSLCSHFPSGLVFLSCHSDIPYALSGVLFYASCPNISDNTYRVNCFHLSTGCLIPCCDQLPTDTSLAFPSSVPNIAALLPCPAVTQGYLPAPRFRWFSSLPFNNTNFSQFAFTKPCGKSKPFGQTFWDVMFLF